MPRLREVEGLPVLGARDRRVGTIERVLFHPSEARAVGFLVRPARWFGIVTRAERFAALGSLALEAAAARVEGKRLPPAKAANDLGYDWETTVIWRGMPVRTSDGTSLGTVADAVFGARTGKLKSLRMTGGALADAALGKRELEGEHVEGFDGEAVVVSASALGKAADTRGLAAAAGVGAGFAKAHGSAMAKRAGEASVQAAGTLGKSIRKGRNAWRRLRQAASESSRDEDAPKR